MTTARHNTSATGSRERVRASAHGPRTKHDRHPTEGETGMTHDHHDVETEYLTIGEAAELLRVPVATLRWWRSQLIGPPSRKFGRHIRYGKHELLGWADQQGRVGGQPAR